MSERIATTRSRYCRVLRDSSEIDSAVTAARERGLCPSPDARKSWDNVIAVDLLSSCVSHDEAIADLGCRSGILLTWLHQLGYSCLHGCDIRRPLPPIKAAIRKRLWRTAFEGSRMYASSRRRLVQRPVEHTGFPDNAFAAATSISVVEHGVDTVALFAEAARILRPGGMLFLSTDYWPQMIDLGSTKLFPESRGFDRVFSASEIHSLAAQAAAYGLMLIEEPDLDVARPVIRDARAEYTFLALAFKLNGQEVSASNNPETGSRPVP